MLLPEIGLWPGMLGGAAEFTVQACAKYAKARTIYVAEDAVGSAEIFCLLERPNIVRRAARGLERKARDLFVVGEVDVAGGWVRGILDGVVREFQMSALDAKLRRITVFEGEFGLEALTLFVCRGGLMPGADAWKSYRHRAWTRMTDLADVRPAQRPRRPIGTRQAPVAMRTRACRRPATPGTSPRRTPRPSACLVVQQHELVLRPGPLLPSARPPGRRLQGQPVPQ
ncbi:hypothetical protein [Streptomyces sp. NPDC002685]|uniref:hypothetical protein n=1 Tax=Streptomyces sp. NPDC002685 TaxID=3154540 RepID=UPI00331D3809